MFSHPQGSEAWVQAEIERRIQEDRAAANERADKEFLEDAIDVHGEEKVNAAFAYLESRYMARDPVAIAKATELKEARNRYDKLVKWHETQSRLEYANDPKVVPVLEKFRSDPSIIDQFQAFLANSQPGTQQQVQHGQQAAPVVMPSNIAGARNVGTRSGPAWSGPPSLQDIFARN
jgi:hypothetical protein